MQLPCYYNSKDSGAKIDYLDMKGTSAYPFGFGLSYSKFKYSNLKLNSERISVKDLLEGKKVNVTVDVENISDVDGYEVVQLYTVDMESTITRRFKELKGFKKVFIKAGEKVSVEIELTKEEFAIWDINLNNSIEEGDVKVLVGPSSQEFIETTLTIY